jgi:hypothetical protein
VRKIGEENNTTQNPESQLNTVEFVISSGSIKYFMPKNNTAQNLSVFWDLDRNPLMQIKNNYNQTTVQQKTVQLN